jgi:hypothetical protein
MCDDPTSLTPDAREAIEKYADKESRDMGFDNWIDAYHWTPDSQANSVISVIQYRQRRYFNTHIRPQNVAQRR